MSQKNTFVVKPRFFPSLNVPGHWVTNHLEFLNLSNRNVLIFCFKSSGSKAKHFLNTLWNTVQWTEYGLQTSWKSLQNWKPKVEKAHKLQKIQKWSLLWDCHIVKTSCVYALTNKSLHFLIVKAINKCKLFLSVCVWDTLLHCPLNMYVETRPDKYQQRVTYYLGIFFSN